MNQPDNSPIPPTQKFSFLLGLGLSILVINLLVIALVLFSLRQSRQLYEERAAMSTQNLAKVLEDTIYGTIDKIDLCLNSVKYEAEKHLAAGGINKQGFDPFIQRNHSLLPELESLRITDSKGEVILGTGVLKRVNNSDRDYFIRLRDDRKTGLVIAKPLVSRMSGKWVLSIARRLSYPDGSFAGVVYAELTLEHFKRVFSKINIGRNGSVVLCDDELSLITRYPEVPGVANTIGQKQITQEFKSKLTAEPEAGTYHTPKSNIDNLPRTLSYREIANYPLYIIVGTATRDYLGDWKKDATKLLIILAVFIITTLTAAWSMYARWQKQMLLTDELRKSNDELEIRVAERTTELAARNLELSGEIIERIQAEEKLKEKAVQLEEEVGERRRAQEELADKHRELEGINHTLEDRIQNSVAELRVKDKLMIQQNRQAAMGEMINSIAHQWKQPLNNLGLIIQAVDYEFTAGVLTREEMANEKIKCMELIRFMSQTIDDFRNFFLEDKQKSTFGVRESIDRAIKLVSASLKDSHIKLIVEPGDDILINGYPNEYAQVLMNLLGNAKDVLVERQIVGPVISVNAISEAGRAIVTVSDNGGGISGNILEKIFDPYFTTKGQGKGTGIGLFMSKAIIEQHLGGKLTVSNIENGAQFRVETEKI